ncbi:hypothetical protein CGC21_10125 [Leishmania donovani]|uniref:Uncharacterized protein n=1 Tax=Leishmania donovani TaxID=5661 RepID=A0A504XV88_LEIDO|nr:hypothetical protein CGC21_10125 [Leishmania donovani]
MLVSALLCDDDRGGASRVQVREAPAFAPSVCVVHHVNGAQPVPLSEMRGVLFLSAFRIDAEAATPRSATVSASTPVKGNSARCPRICGHANPAAAPAMVFDYDADTGSYTVFWPLAASCTAVSSVLGVMKTPKRRVAYKGSAVTQELWIAVHRNGPHPTRRERLSGGGGEYSTTGHTQRALVLAAYLAHATDCGYVKDVPRDNPIEEYAARVGARLEALPNSIVKCIEGQSPCMAATPADGFQEDMRPGARGAIGQRRVIHRDALRIGALHGVWRNGKECCVRRPNAQSALSARRFSSRCLKTT